MSIPDKTVVAAASASSDTLLRGATGLGCPGRVAAGSVASTAAFVIVLPRPVQMGRAEPELDR